MNKKKIYPQWFLILPLALYIIFFLLPSIMGVAYSFTDWNSRSVLNGIHFVGIDNFKEIFTSNKDYLSGIGNTLKFTIISNIVKLIPALLIAIMLQEGLKGKGLYRTLLYLPSILPFVIIGLVFKSILNYNNGLLNAILDGLHLGILKQKWLSDLGVVWKSIYGVDAWRGIGYVMTIFLAGLNTIPRSYYEAAEMALIDTKVERSFATGIAGFSHVVDSLSAIKYAKVKAIRDEDGITTDFQVEGDFPRYGNDDDRADEIATTLLSTFLEKLKHIHTYRDSKPTTSILTITSNVVYGKATGSLPDGRKAGEPLAPGANPSYGAEQNGLLASLNSVAKLDYEDALDGISNTQTINPDALGHSDDERSENLVHVLDGYFDQGAHHLNVNVFGKEKLIDAMEHPEKEEYANFTIRVSGYAVKFIDLTREQQLDVIARTCHDRM